MKVHDYNNYVVIICNAIFLLLINVPILKYAYNIADLFATSLIVTILSLVV